MTYFRPTFDLLNVFGVWGPLGGLFLLKTRRQPWQLWWFWRFGGLGNFGHDGYTTLKAQPPLNPTPWISHVLLSLEREGCEGDRLICESPSPHVASQWTVCMVHCERLVAVHMAASSYLETCPCGSKAQNGMPHIGRALPNTSEKKRKGLFWWGLVKRVQFLENPLSDKKSCINDLPLRFVFALLSSVDDSHCLFEHVPDNPYPLN